jgi:hypothetical protein
MGRHPELWPELVSWVVSGSPPMDKPRYWVGEALASLI